MKNKSDAKYNLSKEDQRLSQVTFMNDQKLSEKIDDSKRVVWR
jgi:hypothetical protein